MTVFNIHPSSKGNSQLNKRWFVVENQTAGYRAGQLYCRYTIKIALVHVLKLLRNTQCLIYCKCCIDQTSMHRCKHRIRMSRTTIKVLSVTLTGRRCKTYFYGKMTKQKDRAYSHLFLDAVAFYLTCTSIFIMLSLAVKLYNNFIE